MPIPYKPPSGQRTKVGWSHPASLPISPYDVSGRVTTLRGDREWRGEGFQPSFRPARDLESAWRLGIRLVKILRPSAREGLCA